jgi:hypothetical protein
VPLISEAMPPADAVANGAAKSIAVGAPPSSGEETDSVKAVAMFLGLNAPLNAPLNAHLNFHFRRALSGLTLHVALLPLAEAGEPLQAPRRPLHGRVQSWCNSA